VHEKAWCQALGRGSSALRDVSAETLIDEATDDFAAGLQSADDAGKFRACRERECRWTLISGFEAR
jgi:hypothetical protein